MKSDKIKELCLNLYNTIIIDAKKNKRAIIKSKKSEFIISSLKKIYKLSNVKYRRFDKYFFSKGFNNELIILKKNKDVVCTITSDGKINFSPTTKDYSEANREIGRILLSHLKHKFNDPELTYKYIFTGHREINTVVKIIYNDRDNIRFKKVIIQNEYDVSRKFPDYLSCTLKVDVNSILDMFSQLQDKFGSINKEIIKYVLPFNDFLKIQNVDDNNHITLVNGLYKDNTILFSYCNYSFLYNCKKNTYEFLNEKDCIKSCSYINKHTDDILEFIRLKDLYKYNIHINFENLIIENKDIEFKSEMKFKKVLSLKEKWNIDEIFKDLKDFNKLNSTKKNELIRRVRHLDTYGSLLGLSIVELVLKNESKLINTIVQNLRGVKTKENIIFNVEGSGKFKNYTTTSIMMYIDLLVKEGVLKYFINSGSYRLQSTELSNFYLNSKYDRAKNKPNLMKDIDWLHYLKKNQNNLDDVCAIYLKKHKDVSLFESEKYYQKIDKEKNIIELYDDALSQCDFF